MPPDLSLLDKPPSAASAAALGQLWELVRMAIPKEASTALGEIHVGAVDAGHPIPWAHTNAGEGRVNLTLELKEHQLELNLVGWNERQADGLKDWLQSVRGEDVINSLAGYQVVAFRRRAYKKTSTSKPWWQEETIDVLGRCDATQFRASFISKQMFRLGSPKEEKAAFHVRRAWPIAEARARGDELIEDLAREVQRLLPILREIWARSEATM